MIQFNTKHIIFKFLFFLILLFHIYFLMAITLGLNFPIQRKLLKIKSVLYSRFLNHVEVRIFSSLQYIIGEEIEKSIKWRTSRDEERSLEESFGKPCNQASLFNITKTTKGKHIIFPIQQRKTKIRPCRAKKGKRKKEKRKLQIFFFTLHLVLLIDIKLNQPHVITHLLKPQTTRNFQTLYLN